MQMTSSIKLILLSFLLIVLVANAISPSQNLEEGDSQDYAHTWCDTVPHPEPCKLYMGHKLGVHDLNKRNEFRIMMIEVAMERAMDAKSHAWFWGRRCESHKERVAWIDCIKLYDNTIIQLNRTLEGLIYNPSCTNFDAQTWLSTALTNLDTCTVGSEDMNVTRFIWPHVSYNVSELISNGLAINHEILGNDNDQNNATTTTIGGYPSWLSQDDRRRLRASRSLVAAKAKFIVAKDGSSKYKTIQSAIDAAAKSNIKGRKVIYVKKGVYRENIHVGPFNNDIMLVGDGIRNTVITGKRSVRGGYTTYNSATAGIDGLRFIARGITFQNAAGPHMGQAVALRSGSDLSVFYKCAFYGYQDTLLVHSQRQFYKRCFILGTIDIIFGNAAVVFQSCTIMVRKPVLGQANVITAQGRADPNQNTGIVIHRSIITAANDFKPSIRSVDTFLGRPWQKYSRTIVMKSYLDTVISTKGWLNWQGKRFESTLYYAEHGNYGPGAKLRGRVKWPGYHIINSPNVASRFTVGSFIAGRAWLRGTGVPFYLGL